MMAFAHIELISTNERHTAAPGLRVEEVLRRAGLPQSGHDDANIQGDVTLVLDVAHRLRRVLQACPRGNLAAVVKLSQGWAPPRDPAPPLGRPS